MSGNPYLDAYEQQSSTPNAPDAYAAYRSRRLSRLRRLQEEQDRQDEAAKAQSAFGQTPTEPTPVQKRMLAAQDAYESEIKKYGVAEGPTVQEFANTRDPRMVQMQLDREAEAKKQEAEFWKAVQAGDDGAINSALDAMAPAWDKLREQKAQIEAAKQHLASLDPATHADEILRAKPVLEDAYAQLQKTEAHLTELGDRVNAGIGARTAGEMSAAAKMDTYGARFSKFSIPTLAAIGDFLGKGQRVVSAMLAIPKNLAQGQFHAKELKAFVPGYNLFSKDVQGAGAQMNAEVGNALGQYVKEAEGDFTGQNALRGLYNPLGGALVGTSRIAAQAEEGYDIAKAKVSGEDYVPEMSGAERRASWGDTLGGLGYQIVTDPLSYIPVGAASEVFGKLIKPIEPVLDAVSKRVGLKGAAKVVRALTVGGPALEDPLMAQYAANAKAAEMTAAAPFVEGAYEAQAKLEAKLAAIPPELRPVAQDVAPRALEGIPAAERGGLADVMPELPVDYAEIPVYHGTARSFDALDTSAKRVAILDKPGRGEPVRGIFFSPHKDVAENYVRYAIPRVMAEARAGRAAPGVWRGSTIAESYGKRGLDSDALWANTTAERMFTEAEKRNPLAWRSDAAKRELPLAGVALFSDTPVEGGRVFKFTRENQKELEASLLKIAQSPTLHDKAYIFTKTPAFDPRVIQTTLKGRVLDLTDARAWPKELVAAIQKSSNSEDQRIAKVLGNALNNEGKFSKLNTVERSPTLQNWIKENGYDIVKKPEMDEITGAFSYWAVSEDALKGTKYNTSVGQVPSAKYAEVLKDIPPQHRAVVMDYVQTLGDDAELLKAMTEGRLGRSIELSDNILEGYAARRYDPIFKQWLAANPQVQEALNELKVAQHYAAIGEKVPATNQFASRKFAEGTTFHDAEQLLKEKYGYTGDIWSRNQAEIAHGDWIFAGEAAKRQADMEEWGKVFAHEGAPSTGAVVKAEEFYKKMNARIPEELKGKFFSASDIKDFEKMKAIQTPAAWRKILNNVTNWFSRANLVTPTSLAKDFKGQTVQFGFAAGESGWKYLDKARAIVDGKEAPGIVSNLFASGLGKPSYHTAVNPSVGKVIADFGGGLKGRVAGAIEESGLTGGAIRGVGKAVGAVPGLGTVGRGIEGAGKLVGTGLRKALNARQLTEEYFRVATYLHAIEDLGKTPLEAVQHVAKWWGDFSQLSKLENKVLKGFTMYTSWQLRALKIGMHNLVDRPLRTRLFLQLAAGNVSNNDDFPGWAQRQGGTIIGKDSAGNPKFVSLGAGSYFEPMGDILQGEAMQRLRTDGFAGAAQGVAQSGLRRLVPFLQAPIEYATNYDSFSGSQIRLESGQDTRTRVTDHAPAAVLWLPEGLKKFFGVRPVVRSDTGEVSYIHMDPEWNWLFQKLIPGVESQAGFVSPLADPRKNAFDFAARALGFPTYSVREQDIQSKMKTKIRQATDALRKSVGGTGVAVDDYGNVVFDKTSDLGRQMIEDNARWDSEAKQGRNPDGTPINPDGYKRFKMANKYADALRLIDLGRYLRDWKAALENPGLPDAGVPVKDATSGLRKLGKDEARRDAAAERRALRGR